MWAARGIVLRPGPPATIIRRALGPPMAYGKAIQMTTTVKVHVNGKYRATVSQDGCEPVVVEGNYNGGSGEKSFYLSHPAAGTFVVSEEQVAEGDERPAA